MTISPHLPPVPEIEVPVVQPHAVEGGNVVNAGTPTSPAAASDAITNSSASQQDAASEGNSSHPSLLSVQDISGRGSLQSHDSTLCQRLAQALPPTGTEQQRASQPSAAVEAGVSPEQGIAQLEQAQRGHAEKLRRLSAADPQGFAQLFPDFAHQANLKESHVSTMLDNPIPPGTDPKLAYEFYQDLRAGTSVPDHANAALKLRKSVALRAMPVERFPETAMFLRFATLLDAAPDRETIDALVANPVVSIYDQTDVRDFIRFRDRNPHEVQAASNIALARSLSSASSMNSSHEYRRHADRRLAHLLHPDTRLLYPSENPLAETNHSEINDSVMTQFGPVPPPRPSPFQNAPAFSNSPRTGNPLTSGMQATQAILSRSQPPRSPDEVGPSRQA